MTGGPVSEADALAALRSPTMSAHLLSALEEQRKWLRRNGLGVPAELLTLLQFVSDARLSGPDGTRVAGGGASGESSKARPALLTKAQVAAELGVDVRTVTRLVTAGDLTPIYLTDRCPRFRPDVIEKFKQARESRSWQ